MPLQIRTADDRTKYSDLEIAVGEIQKYADALHKAQKTLNVLTQKYKQDANLNDQELQKLKALRAKGNQIQTNSVQEDHYDEPANDSEEDMLENQVAFIKYAVDEIQDFVKANGDFPEWFQNKFTSVHENVKTLHAFIEGERNKEKRKEMIAMKDREDDYFETLEDKLAQEAEINWAKPDDPTYYVRIKGGKPMIEITGGKFAPVIPSKKWQEITPAISDKAYKQGFRTAPIEGVDGKKYQALVGWLESKKTEVAFVSAKDFVELKNPVKSPEAPSDAGPDGGMK